MSSSRPSQQSKNVELKLAIFKTERTQRFIAHEANIAETRLSDIVNRRGTPPTKDEMSSLAKVLRQSIRKLFVLDLTAAESAA